MVIFAPNLKTFLHLGMNKSQKEDRVLDKEIFSFCPEARGVKYFGVIFDLRVDEVFFSSLSLSFLFFSFFFLMGRAPGGRGGEQKGGQQYINFCDF